MVSFARHSCSDQSPLSRCQDVYMALLAFHEHLNSASYIRVLQHTSKCDIFYDFSDIRETYANALGEECMQRLIAYKETNADLRVALQAIDYYRFRTEINLKSALTWPNWLWYHSVHKVERAISWWMP